MSGTAYNRQGRLADGYQALRIADACAAQDVRRPAVRDLVADMAARDRRRALPALHHSLTSNVSGSVRSFEVRNPS